MPTYLRPSALALALLAAACGSEKKKQADSSGSAKAAGASAAAPASAAPSASASAAAPPASAGSVAAKPAPAPESFGPEITTVAVEAVNASGAYKSNQAVNAVDGKPNSWSAEWTKGLFLEVGLWPGTQVDGIEMAGQRTTKNDKGKEHWVADAVIKRAHVTWDGGEGDLVFSREKDRGVRKKLPIGQKTRFIRIEIAEIEKGEDSSDVDIDELGIFGKAPTPPAADPKAFTGLCTTPDQMLRFKAGALFGGSPVKKIIPGAPPPEASIPITFLPTTARVDDGEWHRLGIKYDEVTDYDFALGKMAVQDRALLKGQADQFRITEGGAAFETRSGPNGTPVAGKCKK